LDTLGLLAAVALRTIRLLYFLLFLPLFIGVVDFLSFIEILLLVIVVKAPECKEKSIKNCKIYIIPNANVTSEIFLLLEQDFADSTQPQWNQLGGGGSCLAS
jgi:hypothetical protein